MWRHLLNRTAAMYGGIRVHGDRVPSACVFEKYIVFWIGLDSVRYPHLQCRHPATKRITLEYYPIFSGMVPVASWIVLPCAAGFRPPASPKRFMVQQYCYVVFAIVVWCMRVGKSSL